MTIPTRCWKIVVVLPVGDNDVKRIDGKTRIIAVDMPNDDGVSIRWRTYLTTVDAIEKQTGYDFLTSVPKKIQAAIEAARDSESESAEADGTNKATSAATDNDSEGREYLRGLRGGCYYLTAWGGKSYVDKKFCESISTPDTKEKKNATPSEPNVAPKEKTPVKKESGDKEYLTGERGGCYYINSSGKKTYVKKELCGK